MHSVTRTDSERQVAPHSVPSSDPRLPLLQHLDATPQLLPAADQLQGSQATQHHPQADNPAPRMHIHPQLAILCEKVSTGSLRPVDAHAATTVSTSTRNAVHRAQYDRLNIASSRSCVHRPARGVDCPHRHPTACHQQRSCPRCTHKLHCRPPHKLEAAPMPSMHKN